MKVYEGAILTVDAHDTVAQYLVEDEGNILFVGDSLPARFANAPVEHLGTRALCPAFVDTHQHFASFATFNAGLNVMNARSNQEIIGMVRDFAVVSRAQILVAFGASPYSVAEGRLLSRQELDLACPQRPVFMVKYDGHACVINTALLERLQEKVPRLAGLRGYHPDSGEMNQEAFFAVSDFITNSLSIPKLIGNMQRAMDYLASRGIGMVHTVSGVGFAGNLDISLEKWVGASAQSGFQMRVFPQPMDVFVATSRRLPRIGGCFESALDGCFGSRDAAMREPYFGGASDCEQPAGGPANGYPANGQAAGDCGVLYYDDAKVAQFCKDAHDAGLQIEMHAIGDAAFDQAVRCLKAAVDHNPRADCRHGIIHACLPTPESLAICAEYGVHFPMQTSFIDWPQEPDSYLTALLGPERASRLNPLRDIWDAGVVISAGSDAPCTDPDPILWMQRACNHSTPGQSLTIQEALRMCTYNGAWVSFDEDQRGSLEEGKVADMVLLSENPYEAPVSELGRLKVQGLILGGKPYSGQRQGFLSAVLKGMVSRAKI